MIRRTIAPLLCLILTVSTCLSAVESGIATRKPPKAKRTTVVDASGRTHVRPSGHITDAQRKAAAQHRKDVRQKSGRMDKKGGVQK